MRTALQHTVGPLLVGIAAWAATGIVVPAGDHAAIVRLAAPGSALAGLAAFAIAMATRSLRQHPHLCLPALISIVPWLPIPLPAIALVWTGRLAWVPVALPFLAAWLARPEHEERPAPSARTASWHTTGAALATLGLAVVTAVALRGALPAGDEPHYLVATQSLLADGDLRVENNYAARDYAAYYPATIDPQVIRRGQDGEIYPVHMPGVSVLVLPFFVLFGYRGAQAAVMLMAAFTGALIWRSGWVATGSRRAAWFAWTASTVSTTFLVQAVTIFPDGPAACAIAAAVAVLVAIERTGRLRLPSVVAASIALTLLPFLHVRLAALSGLVGAAMLVTILRCGAADAVRRGRAVLAFVAPALVGMTAWFGYFGAIYGTVNPSAPYGGVHEFNWRFVPGGLLGLLFDQQFGLFAYSPVLVTGLLVWRRLTSPLVLAAIGYWALVCAYWMWWGGGPVQPARFAGPALPLLAIPIAVLWSRSRGFTRSLLAGLAVFSVAITAVTILGGEGSLFANDRDARALWLDWLESVVDLPRIAPSFFWRLEPDRLASEWVFVRQVLTWVALPAAIVAAARTWASREKNRLRDAAAVSWLLPASVMLAGSLLASAGDDVPLRPALQQLHLLRAGALETIRVVGSGRFDRWRPGGPALAVTVPRVESPGSNRAEWLVLPDVPAGRYELHVTETRPRGGTLTVRSGRAPEPLARFDLEPRSRQAFELDLPAHVAALWFVGDDTLAAAADQLVLIRQPGRRVQ